MDKPVVFISHITEEKEMAVALKELIGESFLGMMEIFVSSDEESLPMGSRWLDNVTEALKNCSIELILCSPQSVKRPWINFEAGAGWIRDIPVIPLCHSGMEPCKLPVPLNLLQAAKIDDVSSLKLIFHVLASAIGVNIPKTVFDDFAVKMKELEEKYTFWDDINCEMTFLFNNYNNIFEAVKRGSYNIELSEFDIRELDKNMRKLIKKGYLSIKRTGGGSFYGYGMRYEVDISSTEEYRNLFNHEQCIYYKQS